jgi:hypothetical protein
MKKREMARRMIVYNMERIIKIAKAIIQIIENLFRMKPLE